MNESSDEGDDPPMTAEQEANVARLSSEQIQRFDEALLGAASDEWRKVARIIGTAMLSVADRPRGVPDLFFSERLQVLVQQGSLESVGNLKRMRFSEVRKPRNAR